MLLEILAMHVNHDEATDNKKQTDTNLAKILKAAIEERVKMGIVLQAIDAVKEYNHQRRDRSQDLYGI